MDVKLKILKGLRRMLLRCVRHIDHVIAADCGCGNPWENPCGADCQDTEDRVCPTCGLVAEGEAA